MIDSATNETIAEYLISSNDREETLAEFEMDLRELEKVIDSEEITLAIDENGSEVYAYIADTSYADYDDMVVTQDNIVYCQASGASFALHCNEEITAYDSRDNSFSTCEGLIGNNYDYCFVNFGNYEGDYIHVDLSIYCVDIDERVHSEDANFCDVDDEYYYDPDEMPQENSGPEHVSEYHGSPTPDFILDARHQKFRIGFEVEKIQEYDVGDYIGGNGLFSGYETDGSCGSEAITHILPCAIDHQGVRALMLSGLEPFLNKDIDTSCGGHITVSSNIITSNSLAKLMSEKMGLIYSLWAPRLKNNYVSGVGDKACLKLEYAKTGSYSEKYTPMNIKSFGVEIRVPNAVKDANQLWLRYQFMAAFLTHMELNWQEFAAAMWPYVVCMYRNNHIKTAERFDRAKLFQDFIDTGFTHNSISKYVFEGQ